MMAFLARVVSEAAVSLMLYQLEGYGSNVTAYGEISFAIAKASNEDPLFPEHESGCEATACILVAMAWHGSKFHPNLIGLGGRTFGLYQLRPPTEEIDGSLMLTPINASFIALGLVRQSFQECEAMPWPERLTAFVTANGSEGASRHEIVKKSMERLVLAHELFRRFFPAATLPNKLPALPEFT